MDEQSWPAYPTHVHWAEPPAWAGYDLDARSAMTENAR